MIDISVLKDFSYVRKYAKGSVLVQPGDESGTMFIILKGSVCMAGTEAACKSDCRESNNGKNIMIVKSGGRFGEDALFLGKKASAAVIALEDVIALPLSMDMIHGFIKNEPEMTFEIMKDLVQENPNGAYEIYKPSAEAPPAAEKPKKQETVPVSRTDSDPVCKTGGNKLSLFPEGHGSYSLNLDNQSNALLMEKKHVCPLCGNKFTATAVRHSKLIAEHTDRSLRTYYKGVEPLYYDIVTCPGCCYSAMAENFDTPDKTKKPPEILEGYKQEVSLVMDGSNIDRVFAGYYLALVCAPLCFRKHHLIVAKLFAKLRRIYHDCQDEAMERETAKKALEAYMHAYQNVNTGPDLDQQLCLIIGELSFFIGDYVTARKFLFKAKTNKVGAPALKRQAEDLIEDVTAAAAQNC